MTALYGRRGGIVKVHGAVLIAATLVAASAWIAVPAAQRGRAGGAGGQTAPPPRQAAPVDLTGYWVSVVSEDWRFRMMTPLKGDYGGVPLNAAGRKAADAWNPGAAAAGDDACRWYGAASIMRVPGRLHITWQDDTTLRIATDAGEQVRLLHFGGSPPEGTAPSRQGYSVAAWDAGGRGAGASPKWASLRVVTTHLVGGFLRRNGVPYSDKTVLTEYFDRHSGPDGSEWFTVTTIVADPAYLNQEFITSTDFKKEPDASKWSPTPCEGG